MRVTATISRYDQRAVAAPMSSNSPRVTSVDRLMATGPQLRDLEAAMGRSVVRDSRGGSHAVRVATGVVTPDGQPLALADATPAATRSARAIGAGAQFLDGSFELNGTTIAVHAEDTVEDLVDRINTASAGVVAAYDEQHDEIELTSADSGALAEISLGNDTSTALEQLGLGGAVGARGTAHQGDEPLRSVAAFAPVISGAITINGVSIEVDPEVDSLNGILERITAETPANAVLDPQTSKVSLRPHDPLATLEISDTSGALASAGIVSGTYVPAWPPGSGNERSADTFPVLLVEADDYRPLRLASLISNSRALVERLTKQGTTAILDRLANTPPSGATTGAAIASHNEATTIRRQLIDDPRRGVDPSQGRSYARTDDLLEQVRSLVAATAGESRRDGSMLRSVA